RAEDGIRDGHVTGVQTCALPIFCGPADGGGLLLAPTGVHKERVRTDEFFTVDPSDGRVLRSPERSDLRPSECNSIFCLALEDEQIGRASCREREEIAEGGVA